MVCGRFRLFTVGGCIKSARMTQIGWICADFLYILIRQNAYYKLIDNLRSSIKSALSACRMTFKTASTDASRLYTDASRLYIYYFRMKLTGGVIFI
jgi:hypothetical protein